MRLQRTDSDCAVAALQNALRGHGQRVGHGRISRLLGEVGDGADEQDMLRAICELGYAPAEVECNRHSYACRWLKRMAPIWPCLLCVDDFGHWVVVGGALGHRLLLQDSGLLPYNLAEGGSTWLLPATIARRWRAARRTSKGAVPYYGIAVMR